MNDELGMMNDEFHHSSYDAAPINSLTNQLINLSTPSFGQFSYYRLHSSICRRLY